ncbi:hypothetical protein GP486_008569 [Trichoglossum hirsutum]|uniref:Hydrophobin n=1 Tax=Trichoglossum hirsutum TaxID=265104 RepID=A0A9P8KZG5_9PEZI|nr:hypothetical protein GP486_008569 [Trichoglossum hirsutum]
MMRLAGVLSLVLTLFAAIASPSQYSPFYPALVHEPRLERRGARALYILEKRQGGCPANYNACSNLNAPGACCVSNTNCQLDTAGHVACCPKGAACTGSINVGTQLGSTTGGIVVTASPGSSGGFIVPATTTALVPTQPTAAAGITTPPPVSNQYYVFPAIPTSFLNAAACSTAWSGCQVEYQKCTAQLAGRTDGITISAPGAGITIAGASTTVGAVVSNLNGISICQTLSQQACYGLQIMNCPVYNGVAGGAATICGPAMYGIGVGFALGIAGQQIIG